MSSRPHARTTVVTGTASGIGRATAELLRAAGGRIIGLDVRNADVNVDLSTSTGRARGIAEIRSQCPDGIDALIACAGVAHGSWPDVVAVNFFGATELATGLRPLLALGVAPRVAIVSSSASFLPFDEIVVERCLAGDEAGALAAAAAAGSASAPERLGQVYAASKRALTRWIRRTAPLADWAGAGILLNGVAPGLVRTPMTEPMLATAEGRAVLAKAVPRALAEPAAPEDVALLLAFLASPDNRYLVGQVPFIDGGTDVLMRGDDVPG